MQNPEELFVPVALSVVSDTDTEVGACRWSHRSRSFGIAVWHRYSLLNLDPNWKPEEGEEYALKDFVKYALG